MAVYLKSVGFFLSYLPVDSSCFFFCWGLHLVFCLLNVTKVSPSSLDFFLLTSWENSSFTSEQFSDTDILTMSGKWVEPGECLRRGTGRGCLPISLVRLPCLGFTFSSFPLSLKPLSLKWAVTGVRYSGFLGFGETQAHRMELDTDGWPRRQSHGKVILSWSLLLFPLSHILALSWLSTEHKKATGWWMIVCGSTDRQLRYPWIACVVSLM